MDKMHICYSLFVDGYALFIQTAWKNKQHIRKWKYSNIKHVIESVRRITPHWLYCMPLHVVHFAMVSMQSHREFMGLHSEAHCQWFKAVKCTHSIITISKCLFVILWAIAIHGMSSWTRALNHPSASLLLYAQRSTVRDSMHMSCKSSKRLLTLPLYVYSSTKIVQP